jgi:hypothetical protein
VVNLVHDIRSFIISIAAMIAEEKHSALIAINAI